MSQMCMLVLGGQKIAFQLSIARPMPDGTSKSYTRPQIVAQLIDKEEAHCLLLEETDASGAAQADYIYLNGRPIATLDPSTGALYFLHDDMLGTPQLATDSSTAVAWQTSYQPFGTTSSVSGTITASELNR